MNVIGSTGRTERRPHLFTRTSSPALGPCLLLFLILACPANHLQAHEDPDSKVKSLTQFILEQGPSADLYFRRAMEYRALGKVIPAAEDLREAVRLDPSHWHAQAELGRVRWQLQKPAAALRGLNAALKSATNATDQCALRDVRADVYRQLNNIPQALADGAFVLEIRPRDLDAYLRQASLLHHNALHHEAAQLLEQGHRITASFVLHARWIESLILSGQCRRALRLIEPELASSRWKSSWLIQRARAWQCLQDRDKAREDLEQALAEIQPRVHPERPDLTLIADRGLAHALLGDLDAARRDWLQVQALGENSWAVQRLGQFIDQPQTPESIR